MDKIRAEVAIQIGLRDIAVGFVEIVARDMELGFDDSLVKAHT